MFKRILRTSVVAVVMALAAVAVVESPAFAVGGCNHQFKPLGPCIDYQGGTQARADFYLNVAPSDTYHSFRVAIVSNGSVQWLNLKADFTGTGRYCCWYRSVDSMPDSWHTVFTRVNIYNSVGSLVDTVDSPSINVFD